MARRSAAARKAVGEPEPDGWSAPADVPDQVLSRIRSDFEDYGLNGHQAKVLLALLRVGSAPPPYLAQLSGVHRTSAYPTLEELRAKGLAFQLPGKTAVWSTHGRDEVLERLLEVQEDRVRALQAKKDETAKALATILPDAASATSAVPHIQFVSSASQARTFYERLLREAQDEFLVLDRPPYSAEAERSRRGGDRSEARGREGSPAVMDALGRGVSIRVLYQSAEWDDPGAGAYREAMGVYHDAGVQGGVVDELPMKLAVADRTVALVALTDPGAPEVASTNLLIEHPGYAGFQAAAFEHLWDRARPVAGSRRPSRPARRQSRAHLA